jgi:hypothetical protein
MGDQLLAALALALALPGGAHAGPASGDASASVTIAHPGQLIAIRDLQFGPVSKPKTGTTRVTVASAPAGGATPVLTGGDAHVPLPGQAHAAWFRIVGAGGQAYTVAAALLGFRRASDSLDLPAAEAVVAASGTLNVLPPSGVDDLFVGGGFAMSATTPMRVYSGTLSLTVTFN